jgi:hypothetical protein
MSDALGLCLDCNYPLRGLTAPRCPECGLEFDPANSDTMNMGAPLTRKAQWVLGPMRWPTIAITLVAAALVLWVTRLPRNWLDVSRAGLVVLVLMGIVWLAWPMARTFVARKYNWPKERLTRGAKPRYIVGALLLIEAFAIARGLPLKAAFWMSKPQMDALAADVIARPKSSPQDQWLGAYKATEVQPIIGGGARFTVEVSADGFRTGFMYLPSANPKAKSRGKQYLGDGWWIWWKDG